jgi:hypothetical protein
MRHSHHNPKFDILGMISSGLCLVHCLAGPILLLLGYQFLEPGGWHLLDFLFLTVSALAVYSVTRKHSMTWIKAGLWISFAILSISVFFEHNTFLNISGWVAAGGLILFHYFNFRHSRTCNVH